MQLEPGIRDTGFHAFNHDQITGFDFIISRACREGRNARKYFIGEVERFLNNPNRDRDLHITNNVVSAAIAQAMHE